MRIDVFGPSGVGKSTIIKQCNYLPKKYPISKKQIILRLSEGNRYLLNHFWNLCGDPVMRMFEAEHVMQTIYLTLSQESKAIIDESLLHKAISYDCAISKTDLPDAFIYIYADADVIYDRIINRTKVALNHVGCDSKLLKLKINENIKRTNTAFEYLNSSINGLKIDATKPIQNNVKLINSWVCTL